MDLSFLQSPHAQSFLRSSKAQYQMINNTMGEGNTSTRDMSTINNTMGEGSTSTRDMSTDKINVDLNEYPIKDISLENGYSGTVSEHFDHDIVANDVLEVEEIETYEKENIVSSSQNIEINEFAEEVDRDETYNETNIVPFVGQIFLSEEEAFAFYKRYAYQHGFSVRKGRFIKRNGIMRRRDFFCHREGRSSLKIIEPLKEQRNRESTRCECKAYLRISLQKSHDIFPSEWRVTKFVVEHNHVLLTQSEVRFLPANRTISEDDIERIFLLKEGGLSVRQLMRVIELEKNVKHGRPKRRRLKGGKELSHNMNTCGLCKDVGHNIVTCPLKENTQFSGHTNKKKKICKDANLNPILLPKV
ncbi:Protein FAR1-RELATED SEQUENCE 11 [Glycine max]|nr:Protein FAR1-RELATED SEQUENCE 11 [Glycine max]